MFVISCSHKFLIGLEAMSVSEGESFNIYPLIFIGNWIILYNLKILKCVLLFLGPNTLFSILFERVPQAELDNLHIIFDNACKTHVYALKRERKIFAKVLFQIDSFHGNVSKCENRDNDRAPHRSCPSAFKISDQFSQYSG